MIKMEKSGCNLILEGGGGKGAAFLGAVKVLEESGYIFEKFAGSSAGAIMAGLLAVGYNSEELGRVFMETDFGKFKDDSWGIFRDIYRIFKKFGFYKGRSFERWYGDLLHAKTGKRNITFLEVYERYEKVLVVTGTNLSKRQPVFFHYKTTPNMTILSAVRISISLPLVFQAIKKDNDIYVDGGMLNNYPIDVFDKPELPVNKERSVDLVTPVNPRTIGLKLMASDEQVGGSNVFIGQQVNSFKKYAGALINTLLVHIENSYIKPGYWEQTIPIYTGNIATTDFDLTMEQKDFLVNQGKTATQKWISKQNVKGAFKNENHRIV